MIAIIFGEKIVEYHWRRPAMPGGHRELRHRLREEERARGLHQGLRIRVLDRGRHPHPEEGGQVLQKGEEVLLGKATFLEEKATLPTWFILEEVA